VQNVSELGVSNGEEQIGTTLLLRVAAQRGQCRILSINDDFTYCQLAALKCKVGDGRRNGIGDVFTCTRDGDEQRDNVGEYR
jgi:hypothetical protein